MGFVDKLDVLRKHFSKNIYEKKREQLFKKATGKKKKKDQEGINKIPAKLKRRNVVMLKEYLLKAGHETDERTITRMIEKFAIIFCAAVSALVIIFLIMSKGGLVKYLLYLIATWTVVLALVVIIFWVFFYLFLDLKIYRRTKQVEDVLPDFLQLTSANISAGMPIDRALWYAVRPRFGVLSREIEEVAKSTIAGADLEEALKHFSKKYDSLILKRTVSLIIEGMRAGGELAELLSKIAIDIQETKLMRKEIAASIMTYVIFITFATVVAAPFLFALSTQLLNVVQGIMGSLDLSEISVGMFKMAGGGETMKINDFRIFSALALTVSSIFSAAIVSTIQKGNIKDGAKFIPIFVAVSLILYFVANWIVSGLMAGLV